MRTAPTARKVVLLGSLLGLAALAGCTKKITIYRVPPFWTPDISSIAVIPFQSAAGNRQAGLIVSDQVASVLSTNAAYKRVYNRSHYKNIVDEKRLRMNWSQNPSAFAAPFRRWGKAHAMLVGSVTQYAATTSSQRKRQRTPRMRWNPRTKRQEWTGAYDYYEWVHTRNEANVSANATLNRISDGQQLYSTGPVYGRWASETAGRGVPPQLDPHGCLMAATNQVIQKLVTHLGIVPMQIEVDPAKDFLTANGPPYDNKWPVTSKFRVTDPKLIVVLRLPPACDRNRFRITIIRKGTRKDLESVDFVWKRSFPSSGQSFVFSPGKIAAAGGGPGDYQVKFYAGPEPAMIRDFRIEP